MLNEFLSMLVKLNKLRTDCFESVLGNRWRDSIKRFKNTFIPYMITQAGTGNIITTLLLYTQQPF